MANLVRWDPFREMVTLRDAMDSLFENAFLAPGQGGESSQGWALPLDVTEKQDNFVVKASVPGIKPEDLDITVMGEMLTIKGEMKSDEEKKDERYHLRERRWGSFSRSVTLPAPVKADAVQAEYNNGVLTLTLPKSDEARPKRIAIQGNGSKVISGQGSPKTIEGQSTQR